MRLVRSFSFEGKGLHSGSFSRVTVAPATGPGIAFLAEGKRFPLTSLFPTGDGRGTMLSLTPRVVVLTVEHLLAALVGQQVWEADLLLEGEEVPILDGSAQDVAALVARSCSETVDRPAPLAPAFPVLAGNPDRGSFIVALPATRPSLSYLIEYENPHIGTQFFKAPLDDADFFQREIAPARTFVLQSEVEALRSRGLARGGDLLNTVVFGDEGVLNEGGLRFADECIRHKALDLTGDLAFLGVPLRAHVVAFRSGHALHLDLVQRLRQLLGGGNRSS